jgi:DNA-binding NarL/FixJ family response regulator
MTLIHDNDLSDDSLISRVALLNRRAAAERAWERSWARLLRDSEREVREAVEAHENKIAAAWAAGLSYRQIAQGLGISYQSVARIVRKARPVGSVRA